MFSGPDSAEFDDRRCRHLDDRSSDHNEQHRAAFTLCSVVVLVIVLVVVGSQVTASSSAPSVIDGAVRRNPATRTPTRQSEATAPEHEGARRSDENPDARRQAVDGIPRRPPLEEGESACRVPVLKVVGGQQRSLTSLVRQVPAGQYKCRSAIDLYPIFQTGARQAITFGESGATCRERRGNRWRLSRHSTVAALLVGRGLRRTDRAPLQVRAGARECA